MCKTRSFFKEKIKINSIVVDAKPTTIMIKKKSKLVAKKKLCRNFEGEKCAF